MNTIDWFNASADFMVEDRPDIYDKQSALNDLNDAIEAARSAEGYSAIHFTSYVLFRIVEDGFEEFTLTKKLSGFAVFPQENVVNIYGYAPEVDLPQVDEYDEDDEYYDADDDE